MKMFSMESQRSGGVCSRLAAGFLRLLAVCVTCQLALAAQLSALQDNKGTEFILSFIPNYSTPNVELHLTADAATDVTVEYPVNSPTFTTTVAVTPGAITAVSLPVQAA